MSVPHALLSELDGIGSSDAAQNERLDAVEGSQSFRPLSAKDPIGAFAGAVGDGVADDTAALQRWIDTLTGTADPAANTRTALRGAYLPKGTYRITSSLIFRSIQGLALVGDQHGAVIQVDAAMESAVWFDGISRSRVTGILIEGTSNGVCDYGVTVSWTTAASRSTTKTSFHDIRVENLKCKSGFHVEPFNSSRQNDPVSFYNCVSTGLVSGQPGYDSNYYKAGYKVGSSANGNTYNIFFHDCSAVRWDAGLEWNGGGGSWIAGEVIDCPTCFKGQPNKVFEVSGGFRSEGCGMIYDAGGGTTIPQTVDIGDIWFGIDALRTDGEIIKYGGAGTLNVHDIVVHGVKPGGSADPCVLLSDNAVSVIARITAPTPVASFISAATTSSANYSFSDYNETNASGVTQAQYQGDIYHAKASLKTAQQAGAIYRDSVSATLMRKGTTANAARRVDGPQLRNGQLGFFCPTAPYTRPADLALTAGLLIATRATFDEEFTTVSASFVVTVAAGSADNVDLVIFTKSGISSGTARARSGVVTPTGGALNSTGKKTVTWIAPLIALVPTVYYVGILCPAVGSTPASIQGADFGSAAAIQMFGTAHPIPEVVQKAGLADTSVLSNAGFAFPSNGLGPAIWLNE